MLNSAISTLCFFFGATLDGAELARHPLHMVARLWQSMRTHDVGKKQSQLILVPDRPSTDQA
jgi:hypothetical protein